MLLSMCMLFTPHHIQFAKIVEVAIHFAYRTVKILIF